MNLRRNFFNIGVTKIQTHFALSIIVFELLVPKPFIFARNNKSVEIPGVNVLMEKQSIAAPTQSIVMLSEEEQRERKTQMESKKEPVSVLYMQTSAYNSVPGQTDGSPYFTAIGSMTRKGVVASNYFPIGTYIEFPDLFPGEIFRVEDRMNPRYNKVVDILVEDEIAEKIYEIVDEDYPITSQSTADERLAANIYAAKKFGRRYLKIHVIKWGNNCRSCQ